MKKIIIISAVVVLLVGGGIYYFTLYPLTETLSVPSGVEYKFKSVKMGDITDKISEVGKLEPLSLVRVKSNVTGTVKKIFVKEGDFVKEGQKLALVKPGREAEQYQESEVVAPIPGMVIERTAEEGDMVTSGLTDFSNSTAMFVVAKLDKMIVKIDVNEVDIGSVRIGLAAKIKVEAFPDKEYSGRVMELAPQAKPSTDGRVNIFKTKIEVAADAVDLHPGMKSVVEIVLREKKDVVIAPIECVFEEDKEQCVYMLKDNIWERRKIKTGLYDDNNIEIIEGLTDKDKLATTRPGNFEKLFKEKQEQNSSPNARQGRMGGGPPGGLIR